ncbi:MAG: DedA family protein [Myxococcaceae bacterium]|nr:DedA family protein [Myxococcaceae bacterium]
MLEAFDALVRGLGAWGVLLLGLAALLEYVFPPFPGDTVTLLGGAYSERGEHPVWLVLVSLMLFSVGGMTAMWAVGRAIGHKLDAAREGPLFFGITHQQVRRAQALMRERGDWVLVLNRFMPSFRAMVFVAAGASGTPLPRVVAFGSLSALGWNGLLIAVGAGIGANADRLQEWLVRYRLVALGLTGLLLVVLLVRWLLRRRRR